MVKGQAAVLLVGQAGLPFQLLPALIQVEGAQGGGQVCLVALHGHAGFDGLLRVPAAGDIALCGKIGNVLPHDNEAPLLRGAELAGLGDGKPLAHDPVFPVIHPGVEAGGEHPGPVVVQGKGHPDGGVGDAGVIVLRLPPGIGKTVYDGGHAAEIGQRAHGPLQIGAVGQEGLVILPAVGVVQVDAARRVAAEGAVPGPLEAPGIGPDPEGGLQLRPVQGEGGQILPQLIQGGGEGVEHRHGLVGIAAVGEGVCVGDQDVVGAAVIPAVGEPLILLLQGLLPLGVSEILHGRHFLLVGHPFPLPGGEVQGDLPLGRDGIVFLLQGQGEHGSGVGHEGGGLVVAAAPGGAAGQGDAAGVQAHAQSHDEGQAGAGPHPGPEDAAPGPHRVRQAGDPGPQLRGGAEGLHLGEIVRSIHRQTLRSSAPAGPSAPGRARKAPCSAWPP